MIFATNNSLGHAPHPCIAIVALAFLVSCGGAGSESPSAASPPPAATVSAADLEVARRLYVGTERVPTGFAIEPRPANVAGLVATRHLKNIEVDPAAGSAPRHFEVCTNDLGTAIAWSESAAAWNGAYSDMVEVASNDRIIEIARVPRADVTALLRHRMYRCDYLDRSATDLRVEQGDAGIYRRQPIDAAALKALAEYLWQFSGYNNSDYVVVSSTAAAPTAVGEIDHAVRIAQLVRGAANACDTIRISDWTHHANRATGVLRRSLTAVRAYAVRNTASGAQACAP